MTSTLTSSARTMRSSTIGTPTKRYKHNTGRFNSNSNRTSPTVDSWSSFMKLPSSKKATLLGSTTTKATLPQYTPMEGTAPPRSTVTTREEKGKVRAMKRILKEKEASAKKGMKGKKRKKATLPPISSSSSSDLSSDSTSDTSRPRMNKSI
ncbi:MAG: hypothetical protein BYD32DRAFT_458058 [Podila humilis]|nr:MAG: hypothetical protein BYD32DRAFT_458058 [Podila humilis]